MPLTFEEVRRASTAGEIADLDRILARRTLRPGTRIAVGGARGSALRRASGEPHGYADNGFTLAGREVCAMTGCHRPRGWHEEAP